MRHSHHNRQNRHDGGRSATGVYNHEGAFSSLSTGYGDVAVPPARVSTAFGLPDRGPGMYPSTVLMAPLARPPPPRPHLAKEYIYGSGGVNSGKFSMFGGGGGGPGSEEPEPGWLPVLFAAAGDKMVASVVRREAGAREEVHPAGFVGPSGARVSGGRSGGGGRRSSSSGSGGGLVVRSAAVLPLRRLLLLGCSDGWVRVGT